MTFAELKDLLFARSNFGVKLGLARMRTALALLDDPHLCAPSLHVAGTNGKGSTCAFAAAALEAAGLRVGLYTSPHLRHFCERICIQGEKLPEERAAALLEEVLLRVPWALRGGPAGATDGDGLTFFELTTLLGFLAFARAGVQAMVVEVGMGGRLDATNVVEPLACAIAPIGLEHQEYLGRSLSLIAREKAGIIKRGVPVASSAQPLAVAREIARAAVVARAPLYRPARDYRYERREERPFAYQGPRFQVRVREGLPLAGLHQRGNAALACSLLEAAAGRGLPISARDLEAGLPRARWPGRLERAGERPLVLLDGAHNPHAASALAAALPALTQGRPLQLVFGALRDKDVAAMLEPLLPLCKGTHLCAPASPRAVPPADLAALVRALSPKLSASAHASPAAALSSARTAAGEGGAVLACGSLYLVGELQAVLEGRRPAPMPAERF